MPTRFHVLVVSFLVFIVSIASAENRVRHYYIQAEDAVWDFAPTNQNLVHGGEIPDPWTNSHVFPKARYIEYTDASFTTPKPQPQWLGVLGPIIRAEVGDKVIAHFRNRAFIAGGSYGMHPHGFRYTKDNEGAHCRQEREQKFLSEGSLITSGLPTKTAARVWAIPARSCGGITLT